MTGLKTDDSSQSRQPEQPSEPPQTQAQVAATELESVFQRGGTSNSKAKPITETRRSSTVGMVLSLGIIVGCVALIVNWFVQQLTSRMPAATQQPSFMQGSLLQGMQPGVMQSPQASPMQSPQANLMQSLQPSSMGSPMLPAQPMSNHYQVPSNLPAVGFRSQPLLAAHAYRHPVARHQTQHAPQTKTKKAPAKKPVQYIVPTKMY